MNRNKQLSTNLMKRPIVQAIIIKVNDSFYINRSGTYMNNGKKFKQLHFVRYPNYHNH